MTLVGLSRYGSGASSFKNPMTTPDPRIDELMALVSEYGEHLTTWPNGLDMRAEAARRSQSVRIALAIRAAAEALRQHQARAAKPLVDALEKIINFSDSAMADGDGARETARAAIEASRALVDEPSTNKKDGSIPEGEGVPDSPKPGVKGPT